jgi:hypothetical protein
MTKLEDLVEKAVSPGLSAKAQRAKRSALARIHHIILKYFHKQKGGDGNYSGNKVDDLLTEFEEKYDYQLEGEHADAAAHELTAAAIKKAIPTIGNSYAKLIEQYLKEDDPEKRAELLKQLEMYKGMGAKVGIDPEALETLKKNGYTPDGLNALLENVDKAISQLDRDSLLKQIPENVAYDELDKIRRKHSEEHYGRKFNIDAVKAQGVDAARSVIALDREVKGDKDAFYLGAKQFFTKVKDRTIKYTPHKKPKYKMPDTKAA